MINKELIKRIVKENDRYEGFTTFDEVKDFSEVFRDKNFDTVQIHSLYPVSNDNPVNICGFCGVFKWNDNKLTPLDGDSYTEHTTIWGYEEFDYEDDNSETRKGLEILVEDW